MRKSKVQPLKEVLEEYLKSIRIDQKLMEVRVVKEWYKLSRAISYSTTNAYVKDRKLFVRLNSPTLKNELHYHKGRVVETLNERLQYSVIDEVVIL